MYATRRRSLLHVHCVAGSANVLQQWLGHFADILHVDAAAALHDEVPALGSVDAVLVDWCPEHASVIPRLRKQVHPRAVPIIALGALTPAMRTAALMMQADHMETMPPSPALLEAILDHRNSRPHGATPPSDIPSGGDGIAVPPPVEIARLAPTNGETAEAVLIPDEGPDTRDVDTASEPRIRFDLDAHECYVDGDALQLPYTSFRLLQLLVEKAGKCCHRQEILDTVWSDEYVPSSNVIDYRIHELRKALKPFGLEGSIETVRRVGYRFRVGTREGREAVGALTSESTWSPPGHS